MVAIFRSILLSIFASKVVAQNRFLRDADRALEQSVTLLDPKTVVVKTEAEQTVWRYPLAPETLMRRLLVLSFGSSHTWGAGLRYPQSQAYPFLLGEPGGHVVNVALRATGADYPSVCLQSMIPHSDWMNFDVITLEFRSCGDNSFEFLLKRLRDRYPDAVIIFVHLWHPLYLREKELGLTPWQVGKNPNIDWTFIHGEPCASPWMISVAEKYGAYVYRLPENPRVAFDNNWFQDDWHHLTEAGHLEIANGILEILFNHQEELFKYKFLGPVGLGDQCVSWHHNGGDGLPVYVDGVNIAEKTVMIESGNKYAVEIDSLEGGVITFESNFDELVPVGLMIMSLIDGNDSVAELRVNNQDPVKVDPNFNAHGHPGAHVSMLHQVGFAQKGSNTISIRIINARKRSFRVTGLVLCGACAESVQNVEMFHNITNTLPKVLVFMTSHFSSSHINFLQRCWPKAISRSSLLQSSDVFVFSTGETNRSLLELVFAGNNLVVHEEPNPGYHEGAILALHLGGIYGWFNDYEWVIRLNPDVIIRDDTEIIKSLMNPDIDGIFVNCFLDGRIMLQADWLAFRPSVLPSPQFPSENGHTEVSLTQDMQSILQSGRFMWLPFSGPTGSGHCRVIGDVVVHNHEYLTICEKDLEEVIFHG
jgi:hypothetical protein